MAKGPLWVHQRVNAFADEKGSARGFRVCGQAGGAFLCSGSLPRERGQDEARPPLRFGLNYKAGKEQV